MLLRSCLPCLIVGLSLAAAPATHAASAILVKLAGDGPHATRECLETLHRTGASVAASTADGSDSLDRLAARVGVRGVRALLRRPDGRPFAEQRLAMRARARRLTRGSGPLPDLSHVYLLEMDGSTSVDDAIALYREDPHVVWAQRDHTHDLDDLPNDPFLSSSGSWGQAFEDLWGVYRIRAPEAWEITRGAGVVVAVVDTGLDYEHPDIADNVWLNVGEDLDGNGRVDDSDFNGIDDDGNGFIDDIRGFDFAGSVDANEDGDGGDDGDVVDPDPFDDRGHGTHVAGIIGAVADNGIGIAGIAPEATIMPVKGFPATGPGRDSDLWRAVLYAAENGAEVINTSWSCNPLCPENPLGEEVVQLVRAMGAVIVTSAGNSVTDVVFNSPENMRDTITVASSGQDDMPSASFSNFGFLVDVSAPGGSPSGGSVPVARRNILSLRSSGDASDPFASVGAGYWRLSGTSMSAPHVAGVAALLRSAVPGLDYEQVRRRIRQGSVDLGPPGHDRWMGAGRLDAFASLTASLPDLSAAITGPRQGSVFVPAGGSEVEIRGTAAGADLASFQLSYGLGGEPDTFVPLGPPRTEEIRDDVLGVWSVDGLEEGSYLVRLDVTATDGTVFPEFLLVSLERGRFRRISSPGRPAGMPDVSGNVVVWQSERDAEDPSRATEDLNLFATLLPAGRQLVVQDAPGDQELPSISGRNVTWLDRRNDLGDPEVFGCRLTGRLMGKKARCQGFAASDGFTTNLPPASAAGSLYWIDGRSGEPDVRACRPRSNGGGCEPHASGLEPQRRAFLRTDGAGLVWSEPGSHFGLCDLHRKSGECSGSTVVADPLPSFSQAAASDGLLAWVGFDFRGRNPLQICEVDRQTGGCTPLQVATRVLDPTPKLSGNRLVWDGNVGDQESDVFFCEYDRVLGRCPVQRITAHMSSQRFSDVDGDWVVWQDERTGPSEVWGLELPRLAKLRDRRTREGALLRIPVRVAMRRGADVVLAAEAAGHESLEDLGASFRTPGSGTAWLLWRPSRGQAGSYAFTFSATTDTGLVTRRTIRVEVLPGRLRDDRSRGGWRRIAHRSVGSICVEMPLHLVDDFRGKACRP